MRVDRDAAAIVAHGDPAVGVEFQLDARREAGDRLVHRIVERLGGEMVQRALVGAADIHAGAAAHRLQTFEDLDILGGIAVRRLLRLAGPDLIEKVCHVAQLSIGLLYTDRSPDASNSVRTIQKPNNI